MIEYLRQKFGLQRIAIVDTDVHHGRRTRSGYLTHDPDTLLFLFTRTAALSKYPAGFMMKTHATARITIRTPSRREPPMKGFFVPIILCFRTG